MGNQVKLSFWNYFWFIIGLWAIVAGITILTGNKEEAPAAFFNFLIGIPAIILSGVVVKPDSIIKAKKWFFAAIGAIFGILALYSLIGHFGLWVISRTAIELAILIIAIAGIIFGLKKHPDFMAKVLKLCLAAFAVVMLLFIFEKVFDSSDNGDGSYDPVNSYRGASRSR